MDDEKDMIEAPTDVDIEAAKPESIIETGWDGPQDQENPRNWSTWKKVFHTAIPALYGFVA